METRSNTFSVIFHLRKDRLQDEKLPIYARITIMGKRIELAMKQKIKPEDWNEARGMEKPKKEE